MAIIKWRCSMHVKNDLMYGISEEKENDAESEKRKLF